MRGFLIAFTFFTRIPLPIPKNVSSEEFLRSYKYYPFVGLVLGLILWLLAKVLLPYYPPLVLGALILVAELVLTGGIHLDGFMDSMDGLLSARSPEKILDIMKDSRVGAHASMALVGLLLLKFTFLANLTVPMLPILIVMPMLSRWVFQIGMIGFPYARSQGLGKGFHEATQWIPFLLSGVVVCGISYYLLGFAGPIAFGVSALVIFLMASRISSLLGGLTGDLYGAFIELSEVICLVIAFPFIK
ncbi:adenosylcobinamide-GDP ribazoletransferase [Desulfosporosinus sp. BICA1-9]|uniref:adenosylcobinamide-GDP ribazoletransferase n=1 Tax=Desulfosporosinus sp. BICA1-9 TaxID=1531958 RepID=UPI00054C0A5F|nr:adenosylcobinamide-GDP ribazoletransferase [Desulfosporosinus sp. BICA1-9]KJS48834.1 MAG: cobalamin synthase [Peptococcaceae bacterium BRH_c23]KJS87075.1 MAG: cobalamin synthase [Desulfosporosinus sp. BICA1-9]HBW34177.1 adenosylcobinamide-GDP ribazoletransferase [Desulfosporosinus sp.]